MNLKTNLILMMLMLLNVALFAQDGYNLTGNVVDSGNEPLIGVNVLVASTSTGTVTDIDGSNKVKVKRGDNDNDEIRDVWFLIEVTWPEHSES